MRELTEAERIFVEIKRIEEREEELREIEEDKIYEEFLQDTYRYGFGD